MSLVCFMDDVPCGATQERRGKGGKSTISYCFHLKKLPASGSRSLAAHISLSESRS